MTTSGTDLPTLTDQNRMLKYGEGGESGSYEIETSNSPTLVVHSLGSEGQVTVTANVDNAKLTVDGREVKRGRNGGWQVHKPLGKPYNFVLSAEGYVSQQWTMELQRGQTLKEPRTLVSEKKEAVKSSLILANNPPGTIVEIDNTKIGELDASGKGQFPNSLESGRHTIVLRQRLWRTESRLLGQPSGSGSGSQPEVDSVRDHQLPECSEKRQGADQAPR